MSNYLNITELDFTQIKSNLKAFLQSQNQFSDFDFEGSGMSVLLDLLSYNTHYNAFYMNAAINESFLSTATKRKNIINAANAFSYIPYSKTGAKAVVDLEITVPESTLINAFGGTDYGIVQLEKNNRFKAKIDNVTYIFVNTKTITLRQLTSTTFEAKSVELKQGVPNTFEYLVDASDSFQRYVIPDQNVDTTTLQVRSQAPSEAQSKNYTFYKNISVESVSSTTPVYFLFENSTGNYEVSFGDGKFGYKPVNNETITFDYLAVIGDPANGAQNFTGSKNIILSGNSINDATITITTKEKASGGTFRENDESVRFYAPKYYLTQGNAIVQTDYVAILRQEFPNLESFNAWGGENNSPPKYGRVFIVAKPFGSLYLTEGQKSQIRNVILSKMVTTVRPEIIDPKYTYLTLSTGIRFNSTKTVKQTEDLKQEVIENIKQETQNSLNKFKKAFIFSDLLQSIKSVNSSFQSVSLSVRMKKEFSPELNIATSYTFYFQNEIFYPYTGYIGSITSSSFTYGGVEGAQLEQDADGDLSVVATINSVKTVLVQKIGFVDYTSGVVVLKAFRPDDILTGTIKLFVTPKNSDIETRREFILTVKESDIDVNLTDLVVENGSDGETINIDVSTNAF